MSNPPSIPAEQSARTLSDAEALDRIVARYKTWGQSEIFENVSSTIEFIGDVIEETGRKAWFETAGYLEDSDAN